MNFIQDKVIREWEFLSDNAPRLLLDVKYGGIGYDPILMETRARKSEARAFREEKKSEKRIIENMGRLVNVMASDIDAFRPVINDAMLSNPQLSFNQQMPPHQAIGGHPGHFEETQRIGSPFVSNMPPSNIMSQGIGMNPLDRDMNIMQGNTIPQGRGMPIDSQQRQARYDIEQGSFEAPLNELQTERIPSLLDIDQTQRNPNQNKGKQKKNKGKQDIRNIGPRPDVFESFKLAENKNITPVFKGDCVEEDLEEKEKLADDLLRELVSVFIKGSLAPIQNKWRTILFRLNPRKGVQNLARPQVKDQIRILCLEALDMGPHYTEANMKLLQEAERLNELQTERIPSLLDIDQTQRNPNQNTGKQKKNKGEQDIQNIGPRPDVFESFKLVENKNITPVFKGDYVEEDLEEKEKLADDLLQELVSVFRKGSLAPIQNKWRTILFTFYPRKGVQNLARPQIKDQIRILCLEALDMGPHYTEANMKLLQEAERLREAEWACIILGRTEVTQRRDISRAEFVDQTMRDIDARLKKQDESFQKWGKIVSSMIQRDMQVLTDQIKLKICRMAAAALENEAEEPNLWKELQRVISNHQKEQILKHGITAKDIQPITQDTKAGGVSGRLSIGILTVLCLLIKFQYPRKWIKLFQNIWNGKLDQLPRKQLDEIRMLGLRALQNGVKKDTENEALWKEIMTEENSTLIEQSFDLPEDNVMQQKRQPEMDWTENTEQQFMQDSFPTTNSRPLKHTRMSGENVRELKHTRMSGENVRELKQKRMSGENVRELKQKRMSGENVREQPNVRRPNKQAQQAAAIQSLFSSSELSEIYKRKPNKRNDPMSDNQSGPQLNNTGLEVKRPRLNESVQNDSTANNQEYRSKSRWEPSSMSDNQFNAVRNDLSMNTEDPTLCTVCRYKEPNCKAMKEHFLLCHAPPAFSCQHPDNPCNVCLEWVIRTLHWICRGYKTASVYGLWQFCLRNNVYPLPRSCGNKACEDCGITSRDKAYMNAISAQLKLEPGTFIQKEPLEAAVGLVHWRMMMSLLSEKPGEEATTFLLEEQACSKTQFFVRKRRREIGIPVSSKKTVNAEIMMKKTSYQPCTVCSGYSLTGTFFTHAMESHLPPCWFCADPQCVDIVHKTMLKIASFHGCATVGQLLNKCKAEKIHPQAEYRIERLQRTHLMEKYLDFFAKMFERFGEQAIEPSSAPPNSITAMLFPGVMGTLLKPFSPDQIRELVGTDWKEHHKDESNKQETSGIQNKRGGIGEIVSGLRSQFQINQPKLSKPGEQVIEKSPQGKVVLDTWSDTQQQQQQHSTISATSAESNKAGNRAGNYAISTPAAKEIKLVSMLRKVREEMSEVRTICQVCSLKVNNCQQMEEHWLLSHAPFAFSCHDSNGPCTTCLQWIVVTLHFVCKQYKVSSLYGLWQHCLRNGIAPIPKCTDSSCHYCAVKPDDWAFINAINAHLKLDSFSYAEEPLNTPGGLIHWRMMLSLLSGKHGVDKIGGFQIEHACVDTRHGIERARKSSQVYCPSGTWEVTNTAQHVMSKTKTTACQICGGYFVTGFYARHVMESHLPPCWLCAHPKCTETVAKTMLKIANFHACLNVGELYNKCLAEKIHPSAEHRISKYQRKQYLELYNDFFMKMFAKFNEEPIHPTSAPPNSQTAMLFPGVLSKLLESFTPEQIREIRGFHWQEHHCESATENGTQQDSDLAKAQEQNQVGSVPKKKKEKGPKKDPYQIEVPDRGPRPERGDVTLCQICNDRVSDCKEAREHWLISHAPPAFCCTHAEGNRPCEDCLLWIVRTLHYICQCYRSASLYGLWQYCYKNDITPIKSCGDESCSNCSITAEDGAVMDAVCDDLCLNITTYTLEPLNHSAVLVHWRMMQSLHSKLNMIDQVQHLQIDEKCCDTTKALVAQRRQNSDVYVSQTQGIDSDTVFKRSRIQPCTKCPGYFTKTGYFRSYAVHSVETHIPPCWFCTHPQCIDNVHEALQKIASLLGYTSVLELLKGSLSRGIFPSYIHRAIKQQQRFYVAKYAEFFIEMSRVFNEEPRRPYLKHPNTQTALTFPSLLCTIMKDLTSEQICELVEQFPCERHASNLALIREPFKLSNKQMEDEEEMTNKARLKRELKKDEKRAEIELQEQSLPREEANQDVQGWQTTTSDTKEPSSIPEQEVKHMESDIKSEIYRELGNKHSDGEQDNEFNDQNEEKTRPSGQGDADDIMEEKRREDETGDDNDEDTYIPSDANQENDDMNYDEDYVEGDNAENDYFEGVEDDGDECDDGNWYIDDRGDADMAEDDAMMGFSDEYDMDDKDDDGAGDILF